MSPPVVDTDTATSAASSPSRAARHGLGGDVGLMVLRVVLAVVLVGHGGQKLFGWFGGGGLSGTARFFESAGYSPGKVLAFLAGLAEFGGGIAMLLGLATSFAGAALIATMAGATAVKADGGNNAFFAMNNGYEYELLLTVLALAVTLVGAGRFALDHGRFWDRDAVRFGLAGVGIVAALVTVLVR